MNELKIFQNEEFGKVRTQVDNDGNIMFCGNDVAIALGYSNTRDAIKRHCRGVVKHDAHISGKTQEINFIYEPDLYRLVVKSKLPSAERFEKWVFEEVLPSIRKTGSYSINNKNKIEIRDSYLIEDPIQRAKRWIEEEEKRILLETKTQEQSLIIEEQEFLIGCQKSEIEYKSEVIDGLLGKIDLATQRKRINQIVRKGCKSGSNFLDRYSLLYDEFDRKHNTNLNIRYKNHQDEKKLPLVSSKLDYVDNVLNMIPQLYDITCKIYYKDVERLSKEWDSICG